MAVTSIWRVTGNLGKSLNYIENPEKTTNPACTEERGLEGLEKVIRYAVAERKTADVSEEGQLRWRFVTGINCVPVRAREQMQATKRRFDKEDGTLAYHGYQSFAPGEATPEQAHEIGIALAQRLWGDRYEVVVATHLDTESHLHSHFIVNTVSFVDGKKYHRTKQDYLDMQEASDELCRQYGLSVVHPDPNRRTKQYGELRAEQEGRNTWREIIKEDVDEAIQNAMTDREFYQLLKKKGYEIKVGKSISVRPPGRERFVRLTRNFGEDYTPERICQRILSHGYPPLPERKPKPQVQQHRLNGQWKTVKKATGFRALYFHYCYLLGVFPKKKPQNRRRMHFLLKEDLLKLEQITQEARFLGANRIDTAQQLAQYQAELNCKITALEEERRELRRQQRTVNVKSDPERLQAVRSAIAEKSTEMKLCRNEVDICERVAERSKVMEEHIRLVREYEREQTQKQKKERDKQHEAR